MRLPGLDSVGLRALLFAAATAAPCVGLAAQSLPQDEFEPPLADVEALSPEELDDLRAFIDGLPQPSEQHGWRGEELDAEDRVTRPPERQAADLYRAPLTPECALQGPGAVAVVAGGGASFNPDPGASAGRNCGGDLWPGALRHSLQPTRAVSGSGFLLKNVYFSIRNGYAGPGRWTLLSFSPRPPAALRAPRPAPPSVIVPTTVQTSPESLL
jgi:hypothetical protein